MEKYEKTIDSRGLLHGKSYITVPREWLIESAALKVVRRGTAHMTDLIEEVQAITEAHNATKKSDLRRRAIEVVDTFLQANRKRIAESDYQDIRKQCFRVEAGTLGMKPAEIDNHWAVEVEVERLLASLTQDTDPTAVESGLIPLPRHRTPSKRVSESSITKRLVGRFKKLNRRDKENLMRRQRLKTIREALSTRTPAKDGLQYALSRLDLTSRSEIRSVRANVEGCYAKVARADRKAFRTQMLHFYCTLRDFRAAAAFVPGNPRQWAEVSKEMVVYLHLKRRRKAKELARFCEAKLDPEKHFRYENSLRHALSQYYASLGDHERARQHVSLIDLQAFLEYGDYLTPIEIKITEARYIAEIHQKQVRDYLKRKSLSDDAWLLQIHHYLPQIVSRLERVMPPKLRQTGGL